MFSRPCSVATFAFPSRLAPLMLPKCHYFLVVRLRSCQSVATFVFLSHLAPSKLPKYHYASFFSVRPANSKLQNSRYFRVPLQSCALDVAKVSLFTVFSIRLRRRSYQSVGRPRSYQIHIINCFSTRLRPRSYQSVATFMLPSRPAPSKLPKCCYLHFFQPTAASK